MKFGLVDGQRCEAQPGLSGECPVCGAALLAKCGEIRVWHWAHRARRTCDHWWETETEWHRSWKNRFPVEWQERVHRANDGEKHIADVRTPQDLVVEFQHSYLQAEERRSREAFYKQIIWVVDGLRRKRDKLQFLEALRWGRQVCREPLVVAVFSNESALLRDWTGSDAPVLFDFGNDSFPKGCFPFSKPVLWYLYPTSLDGRAFLSPVRRSNFIEALRKGTCQLGLRESADVREHKRRSSLACRLPQGQRPRRLISFQEHLVRRHRARTRRRF